MADPGNVRHSDALDKAEHKRYFTAFHTVYQTKDPCNTGNHANNRIRRDGIDDNL